MSYTKIPKFRRFVIQNFPFIEEDFDALTDYGLMSKVVEYLNTVIASQNQTNENFETLNNAFIELHDYVEHYFDNLDVQEEINNKLDAMVSDGTMSILLSGLLDDFREEIQDELDRQDDKIDALESGTLVASSTAGMTDHSKLYVNTTDGYWYYWNGTTWAQGGVYQASAIADDSIKGSMIKMDTINPFSLSDVSLQPLKTVFKYAQWIHGYRWYNGNLVAADGYVSTVTKVPCYQVAGLTYTSTVDMESPERVQTFRSDGTAGVSGPVTTSGWTPSTVPYTMAITLTEEHFAEAGAEVLTVNYGSDKILIPWLNVENPIEKSILVYGDSLWANCNHNFNYTDTPYNQSTDPCYGYKQYLESVGMTIDNQAISGTTVVNCWNRTTGKFPQAIAPETLADYDAVIISFGRNDSRTSVPLGELLPVSTGTYDDDTFYGALQNIITTLLTKNPKLRIILWTMTQTNAGGYGTESTNREGLKQIDYVNAMKNVAALYSNNVVDLYTNSGINELNLEQYTFEGVHLTNDGYEFAAEYYLNAMINYLR